MTNTCNFWECREVISPLHKFCLDHFQWFGNGEIDDCQKCDRSKYSKYKYCGICLQSKNEENIIEHDTEDLLKSVGILISELKENHLNTYKTLYSQVKIVEDTIFAIRVKNN